MGAARCYSYCLQVILFQRDVSHIFCLGWCRYRLLSRTLHELRALPGRWCARSVEFLLLQWVCIEHLKLWKRLDQSLFLLLIAEIDDEALQVRHGLQSVDNLIDLEKMRGITHRHEAPRNRGSPWEPLVGLPGAGLRS